MALQNRYFGAPDAELEFADGAAAYTSDDVGQVDGADAIRDVGSGRFEANMQVDVDAIAIDGNDEVYHVTVQGSSSATFASDIQNLAVLELGATEVRAGGAIDSLVGRYELPFCNQLAGVTYRYLRLYIDGGGSTWSIDLRAWAVVKY